MIPILPYFLTNESWFVWDPKVMGCYRLTEEATPEAKESFYKYLQDYERESDGSYKSNK